MSVFIFLAVVFLLWYAMPYIWRWVQRWLARKIVKKMQSQMGDAFGQMFGDAFGQADSDNAFGQAYSNDYARSGNRNSHGQAGGGYDPFARARAAYGHQTRGARARQFMRSVSEIITFVEVPYRPYTYTAIKYTVEHQISDADWKDVKA